MNDRMDIVYHYCSAEIFFRYNKKCNFMVIRY